MQNGLTQRGTAEYADSAAAAAAAAAAVFEFSVGRPFSNELRRRMEKCFIFPGRPPSQVGAVVHLFICVCMAILRIQISRAHIDPSVGAGPPLGACSALRRIIDW